MRSWRVVTIIALSTIGLTPDADASCPKNALEISESKRDGLTVLAATNHSVAPITFTLDVNVRRYKASRRTTFTESLLAGESREVLTLTPTSERRAGRYSYYQKCTVGHKDADHDDDHIYQLPYASGRSYRVLQGYGSRFSHTGREAYAVDFNMREGTPVHAARGGIVAHIEESHDIGCWEDGCGRYANFIVILHDDNTTGEYYHLLQNGVLVEPGQRVNAGDKIGLSGNTGHTTMPHLHFGVYRAIDWGREQSIPVRFMTQYGVVDRPRRGGHYVAIAQDEVSNSRRL